MAGRSDPGVLAAVGAWAAIATSTVAHLGPAMALGPLDPVRAWALHRRWARGALDRLGIDVHVESRVDPRAAARGALFVHLNQQTLLAPLLYPVSLPACRLVVNVEFAALPLVGWASLAMGGVAIVRQRPAQARAALARVSERLRQGEVYGISIEGQRSRDGGLSPFKKGPVAVAIEAECDIIPFMTHGEYALWPRGEWKIRPGRVDVVLYPAVPTRGLRYEDRDRIVAELRELAEREHERYARRS